MNPALAHRHIPSSLLALLLFAVQAVAASPTRDGAMAVAGPPSLPGPPGTAGGERGKDAPFYPITSVLLPPLCQVDRRESLLAPEQQRIGYIAGSPVEAQAAFRTSLTAQGWRPAVLTGLPGPKPMKIQTWRKGRAELLLTLQETAPGRSRFLLASGAPPDPGTTRSAAGQFPLKTHDFGLPKPGSLSNVQDIGAPVVNPQSVVTPDLETKK